jgi:Zn-dependent protease with chaperone function/DNA-directed RNA polymerase subunit RPC12/RpoP
MNCLSCENVYNGSSCPKCGTKAPTTCPQCKTSFLPCDDYCSNCGREIRFINYTSPQLLKKPQNLKADHYECKTDKNARTFMSGLWPVKIAARYGIETFSEPTLRSELLGSCVKVSEKQFPQIYAASRVCQEILGIQNNETYISKVKVLQASVYGVGERSYTVLSSGMAEIMDYEETLFILGRQIGHVKSDHLLYLSLLDILKTGVKAIPWVGETLFGVLSFALLNWQRSSELTADRAGLLCCQSLRTATRALTKITLGSEQLFNKIDLDEFLRQHNQQDSSSKWGEYMQVNPFILTRIRELQSFVESTNWQRIMKNANNPQAPEFTCYYCSSREHISDFDKPLNKYTCSKCNKDLFIEKIQCPHCGSENNVEKLTKNLTFEKFNCTICNRNYFEDYEKELTTRWHRSLPENSPYVVLQLPFWTTIDEISNAYGTLMNPQAPAKLSVIDKIRLDKAYRTLINAEKRELVDRNIRQAFFRAINKLEDEKNSDCKRCGTNIFGTFCAYCGLKNTGTETDTEKSEKEWAPEINTLIDVLLDKDLCDKELKLYEEGVFYPSFRYKAVNFYCGLEEKKLVKPSAINALLDKCKNADKASTGGQISTRSTFIIFLTEKMDIELFNKVFKNYKESILKTTHFPELLLIDKSNDGSLKIAFSSRLVAEEPECFNGYFKLIQHILKTSSTA